MHPLVLMVPDPAGISFPHCEDAGDAGSATYTGILLPAEFLRVMKGLFGLSNSLKSPCRILSVGTDSRPADPTDEPDSRKWYLTHSSPQFKKTFFLSVLHFPELQNGPRGLYQNCLYLLAAL